MLVSMTGFGRGQARSNGITVVVEIRSVNHRYLEIATRLPSGSIPEEKVTRFIQKRLSRGKVTVNVIVEGAQKTRAEVNPALAKRYLASLKQLKKELKLSGNPTLEQIVALPGVVKAESQTDPRVGTLTLKALQAALGALVQTRRREGRQLAKALGKRVRFLEAAAGRLRRRVPVVVSGYRKRLKAKIRSMTRQPLDARRVEQEVAFFAKECDIAEELTRIRAHCAHLRSLLSSKKAAGRQMDFVAQELQREVNTVGSKSRDVAAAKLAIQMKGWIGQLREQAQNVE